MLADLLNDTKKEVEQVEEPIFEEYHILKEYIHKLKGISPNPKDHFELDLGMDSLDFVELLSYIGNTFGITLLEEEISKYPNIYELSQFIHEKDVDINIFGHTHIVSTYIKNTKLFLNPGETCGRDTNYSNFLILDINDDNYKLKHYFR